MSTSVQADYLVVGSGAMGMAFTDTIMNETNATVALVDRLHQPGGHWNHAYPFVRLHQPSSFYGVNSRKLGNDAIDQHGWNKGLYELATNSEVCAYFDAVMQQQFLTSERVQYFPMCDYQGEGRFVSLVSGETFQAETAKTVDATYMHVTVPSMRDPLYAVEEGATCVPPNQLARVSGQYAQYVVVGAGKTGMDACLWLLKNGTDPGAIRWIMPRDSWMLDRATIQPGNLGAEALGFFGAQTQAIAESTDIADLFARLQANGSLLRFDDEVEPTMYRCATVTKLELEQLRRIRNIVRMGHVQRITASEIELDAGSVPTTADTLHIDCSADGLERRPERSVFEGNQITLQAVRTCQQVFSAAFIAHVEAAYEDEDTKNELCAVIPHPDSAGDWIRTSLQQNLNQARWAQEPELQQWLLASRLDGFSGLAAALTDDDPEVQSAVQDLAGKLLPAIGKLHTYVAELDAAN